MELFFDDPNITRLPPEDVRILNLRAEPNPDGQRVRVWLELTPFLQNPNGEISIKNVQGQELANASFIECITPKMDFTLHLRGAPSGGACTLLASIFYLEAIQERDEVENPSGETLRTVVDEKQVTFEISI
jgi:hypothetical protein